MIEKLLDFAESHSKLVIATLFCILVGGSIIGGLWINSLQEDISRQKELLTQEALLKNEFTKKAVGDIQLDFKRQQKSTQIIHIKTDFFLQKTDSIFNLLNKNISHSNIDKATLSLISHLEEAHQKYKSDIKEEREYYSKLSAENDSIKELEKLMAPSSGNFLGNVSIIMLLPLMLLFIIIWVRKLRSR